MFMCIGYLWVALFLNPFNMQRGTPSWRFVSAGLGAGIGLRSRLLLVSFPKHFEDRSGVSLSVDHKVIPDLLGVIGLYIIIP